MPAFFLALLAAALVTAAGREAVAVSRLSAAMGSGPRLLAALWLAAAGSSAFAGWLGAELAPQLGPPAKALLIAFALLAAAAELLVLRARPAPREPTRSLAAIVLVLLGRQVTDAARLLVLALAASLGSPLLAAAGGAIASGGVLTAAWALGPAWGTGMPLAAFRWIAAALLVLAALAPGLTGLGLIG